MKKYRLIREYPGSPKLGTIKPKYTIVSGFNFFDRCETPNREWTAFYPEFWQEVIKYPIGTKVYNSQTNTIYTKQVDGWYNEPLKTAYTDEMISSYKHLTLLGNSEEVVEKDYEILSVKSVPLGSIWTCVKNSTFGISYKGDVFYCSGGAIRGFQVLEDLNKGRYSIYSVKRLSDGEVFTVGDLCNPIREYSYNKHKITIIEFCKAGYLRIGSRNYYIGINNIKHSKKPLFTTEDGVDIFESDTFICLSLIDIEECTIDSEVIMKPYDIWENCKFYKLITNNTGNFLAFSTKEAAEEYILMNKPCLSLNDVYKIYHKYKNKGEFQLTKHAIELIELTKSKL